MRVVSSVLILTLLSLIYIILNILDGHSTFNVVKLSSYKSEKNPVARFFIKKLGAFWGILTIKLVSLLVVLTMLYSYNRELVKQFNIVLFIADVFYTYVVIHNYKNLNKMIKRRQDFLKKFDNVLQ